MQAATAAPAGSVRRVFGGANLVVQPHSRQNSISPSPNRTLGNLAASGSSQSLDQFSGTEDERETSLTCPICNEDMITLLQLNRHLDDVHREVEEVQKQTVKSWFQKRIKTAKRLPPVVALNKTLGKSEPFERNGDQPGNYGIEATVVTDEIVTRKHWQQETGNDYCSEPSCGKPLTNKNGHINCRKCGKLFCDAHTMYQMKLSMSAQWEPVRGTWCRVCETCYKTREGYSDTEGASRDLTASFTQTRQKVVDRTYLEVNRLEKRLTKLLSLMTSSQKQEQSSGFWKAGGQDQQRAVEQNIVAWQDDKDVTQCPFCNQRFNLLNRKHHCRLCGRVVCGNPLTGCSSNVGLNVSGVHSEKQLSPEVRVDVRMCQDCKSTIFGRRDFLNDSTKTPKYVAIYENMSQFRYGIEQLLPKFKSLVFLLKESETVPTKAQLDEAHKIRKRLLDLFTQYDSVSKRILQSSSPTETDRRVQAAMNQAATHFLQTHMLPLQSLPKILKSKDKSPLSGDGTETNGGISDAREKELKEKMMVLEEQKYLVGNMMETARKGRRTEEMGALKESLDDLDKEIENIKQELGDLFIE